jgi:hypothetical protein
MKINAMFFQIFTTLDGVSVIQTPFLAWTSNAIRHEVQEVLASIKYANFLGLLTELIRSAV